MSINRSKRLNDSKHIKSECEHWIKHYANVMHPHSKFIELRDKLMYSNLDYTKLPLYMRQEIQGYFDAMYKIYVLDKLQFMYLWNDGNWYTVKQLQSKNEFTHEKLAHWIKENGDSYMSFAWDSTHLFDDFMK